jgi:hypothetical protein
MGARHSARAEITVPNQSVQITVRDQIAYSSYYTSFKCREFDMNEAITTVNFINLDTSMRVNRGKGIDKSWCEEILHAETLENDINKAIKNSNLYIVYTKRPINCHEANDIMNSSYKKKYFKTWSILNDTIFILKFKLI